MSLPPGIASTEFLSTGKETGFVARSGTAAQAAPEPPPAPQWTAPDPRQLPTLRRQLVDQMRNPFEHLTQAEALALGRGTINPDPNDPPGSARLLLADERRRLVSAKLFSITEELTALAVQAGRNLPKWKLRRDDAPSACGFMVFDVPFATYHNDPLPGSRQETVVLVGVSWGPTVIAPPTSVWVTFWSVTNHDLRAQLLREQFGLRPDEARQQAYRQKADLTWDNEALLTFDSDKVRLAGTPTPVDPAGQSLAAETTASWVQTVRAAWLLMKPGSKITEIDERPLPSKERRRAERDGTDSTGVRVVRIHSSRRRAAHPPQHNSESAHRDGDYYSVRFPVSGHVRWQPYPSRGTIEPILIDPFDKGPQDAPYRVGSDFTVWKLDRLPPDGGFHANRTM